MKFKIEIFWIILICDDDYDSEELEEIPNENFSDASEVSES